MKFAMKRAIDGGLCIWIHVSSVRGHGDSMRPSYLCLRHHADMDGRADHLRHALRDVWPRFASDRCCQSNATTSWRPES
eukprot:359551-Chlamydomonas_euryale.AAC.3